jgi:hypothetical protein
VFKQIPERDFEIVFEHDTFLIGDFLVSGRVVSGEW